MKISIHQPNFFPWVGYFEKINYSDIFIFLDDSLVHKKNLDLLNRSSFIFNSKKKFFSIPIKRDFLSVVLQTIRFLELLNYISL